MQKCWFLENSSTISMYRGFSHGNVATTFSCFVSLSDLNESNGIHLQIEILHLFIQILGEFGIILEQVQTLGHLSCVCIMCSRLITPESPRFERPCEIPVNVLYFCNGL